MVQALFHGLYLTIVARYLSAAGLAALLYDHALTIGDEIRLIWAAPRSFLKWIFLINHYLSEVGLIVCANANALGFSQVIIIWDDSPRIVLGLSIALTATFITTVLSTLASILILYSAMQYSSTTQICFSSKSTPASIVLWVAPLVFEITVIFFTALNAVSLPRDHRTPLRRIVYYDGMVFFVAIALSRGLNIAFSVVTEPGLIFLSIYFSWAMVTLSIRRFLIHIRSFEKDTTYCYNLYHLYEEALSPNSGIELRSY
ncbi:hypothetical protein BJV77DRAFT_1064708 [Russula vinacea]|nr:hypothetical protein BJV77DRAFT_1064708 [Russula vinacea]